MLGPQKKRLLWQALCIATGNILSLGNVSCMYIHIMGLPKIQTCEKYNCECVIIM